MYVNGVSDAREAVQLGGAVTQKLGGQEFLRLLVAELQHQNPLEPLKDRDFMAQLAQFSSLDALHRIEASLEAQQALMASGQQALSRLEGAAENLQGIRASLEVLGRMEEHLARLLELLGGGEATGL
ncbi:MAG: flagellar hook capping FlgD N-terminal domain-containing protein [Bacillota bacterium]|nr:flagellar hook capping FlgD N-terminal domain-containing protein [Bacillota bacterium]MDI7248801.1 flagellar hook capping FlgD N-terminal domain-containing protein [Bacillota bacterium]